MGSRNVIEILIRATNEANTKAAFKDLKENYLNIRSAVSDAYQVASKFYDFAINKTQVYAKSVRDLSQNLNISTEEASRLIQVSDDYGISVDKVSNALEMMTKNGVAPSIETMAQLADRFIATQDPTERAAMATKLFGKSWADLTPILIAGGDALRSQAAAVNKALVLTEAQVQAARDYEIQLDNMNDQMDIVSATMGLRMIPALTGILTLTNAMTEKVGKDGLGKSFEDLSKAVLVSGSEVILLRATLPNLAKLLYGNAGAAEGMAKGMGKVAVAVEDVTDAVTLAANATGTYMSDLIIGWTAISNDITPAIEQNKINLLEQALAYDALAFALNGIGDATETYTNQLSDLETQEAAIQAQIELALRQGYSPLGSKIQELNADLAANRQAQADAAASIKLTTAQMIYQQAAAGLDAQASLELARAMGLIDEESYAIATALNDLKTKYDDNKDGLIDAAEAAAGYTAEVEALYAAIQALQNKDVTITVDTIHNELYNIQGVPGGGSGGGSGAPPTYQRQGGGPVYPWQTYTVGEVGPELFRPATAGNIIPANQTAQAGGNLTITQYISNPVAAAVATAQIRALRAARLNASMGV